MIYFLVPFLFFSLLEVNEPFMEKAYRYYSQGVEEKDSYLKAALFNEAIEEAMKEPAASISRNVLIGANLVELGQYSLAEFFFLKALKQDPENIAIRSRLAEAIRLEGVTTKVPSPSDYPPSSFHSALAIILFCLALAWWSFFPKKKVALCAAIMSFFLLLYAIFLIYRAPIFGVLIRAYPLYKTAEENAAYATQKSAPAGVIVTVLDVTEQGSWIKVLTPDGVMGYVPEKALRIVD